MVAPQKAHPDYDLNLRMLGMGKPARKLKIEPDTPLKLDFGCGPNTREGFEGVDVLPFDGKVKHVLDLTKTPWPWKDGSVAEAHASHFVEHLTAPQRVAFINELYRVLVPGGQCQIIVPHVFSERAYGDLTHQWPPVTGFWFSYLNKEWRALNAPHSTYNENVNFNVTWGYSVHPLMTTRNQEFQQFAIQFYKEAAQDMIATMVKA